MNPTPRHLPAPASAPAEVRTERADGSVSVGVIGGGSMAHTHLAAWQRLGIAAAAFSPSGRGARIAPDYAAQPSHSLADLVAWCDIVDICSPTTTHRELAETAFAAGRHVICEKPLAMTHADADAMIAAASAAGRGLCVAHVVRYFAAYAEAHDLIADGAIGTVSELSLRRTGTAPDEVWFHDESLSGGVLTDQMIHDFDYARWVLGEVATVSASLDHYTADGRRGTRAATTLHHVSGATSRLTGGWLAEPAAFTTEIRATGERGEVRHTNTDGTLAVTIDGATTTRPTDHGDLPYDRQLAEFVRVIADGGTPRVTAADALAALDLTIAARTSAATGRPVSLR